MSEKTVFLAGATGAIGSALVPLLIGAGYAVHGSTRRAERAKALAALGVQPVVVDVFDAPALAAALKRIAPAAVIHQLTDLPRSLDPQAMAEAVVRNARIRTEGTRNLVAAALAARLRAHGRAEHRLGLCAGSPAVARRPAARPRRAKAAAAPACAAWPRWSNRCWVQARCRAPCCGTASCTGRTPRRRRPKGTSPLHVEAAAWAALKALERSPGGIFNIAEDRAEVSSEKAKRELGWHAGLRLPREALQ